MAKSLPLNAENTIKEAQVLLQFMAVAIALAVNISALAPKVKPAEKSEPMIILNFFTRCAKNLIRLTEKLSTKDARLSLNLFSQISNTTYASENSSCAA